MKTLFCFFFLTLCCTAQDLQFGQYPIEFHTFSPPIYYFPFYDSVQIIEVDYYSQSLAQGAFHDAAYPHGGSSLHNAMLYNCSNGYLVRNRKGEIIANYGVENLEELVLASPDSCKTITHHQRLNSSPNVIYENYGQKMNERNGSGYRISTKFSPEMHLALQGILDTLGNVAIPMKHTYIDYAHGEYLVERDIHLFYQQAIKTILQGKGLKKDVVQPKRFAIYDSTFQLTLHGSDARLQRIAENCFAVLKQERITFIDRFGNPLQPKSYYSIYEPNNGDLMIYTEKKNDTLFQGLFSRQLQEITPAIFSTIAPFKHGFMVHDDKQRKGYLNLQGKQIVPFELEAETIDFRRDSFIVFTRYVEVPNGKMLFKGLIDSTGSILLPPEYWRIDEFNREIARVQKDNKWGFINRSGEVVCPIVYNSIDNLNRKFIDVTKDNKRGLVDRSGKVVLEPNNYSYVTAVDSMIHCGTDQDEHFIYDLRSGEKYKHPFGKLIPQVNGLSFYIKDEKYGLVDAQGRLMIPAKFEKIRAYRNNRAVVQLNGKYGLIDEHGEIVQAIRYDDYGYDSDGGYLVE